MESGVIARELEEQVKETRASSLANGGVFGGSRLQGANFTGRGREHASKAQ